MVVEQTEGGALEDVGFEPLLSFLILEGLVPTKRGEFEDAAARPVGKQAEQISQIGPRLNVVELATGQQGDEGSVHLTCVVVPDEEPIFAANRLASEGAFGPVVPRAGICRVWAWRYALASPASMRGLTRVFADAA